MAKRRKFTVVDFIATPENQRNAYLDALELKLAAKRRQSSEGLTRAIEKQREIKVIERLVAACRRELYTEQTAGRNLKP